MIKFIVKLFHLYDMRKQTELIRWDIMVMERFIPEKEARLKLLTGLNESDKKQIDLLKDNHTHEARKQREALEKNVKERDAEMHIITEQIRKVKVDNNTRRSEIQDYINRIKIVKAN